MRKAGCRIILSFIISMLMINNGNFGYSQTNETDSLLKVIGRQPDSREKADNLIKLGRLYYFRNYDSSLFYMDKAYALALQLKYEGGQADAVYIKGLISRKRSNMEASLGYLEKYVELAYKLEDTLRLAKGYHQLAVHFQELNDFELERLYCQKSLQFFGKSNDTLGILANYNIIGRMFLSKSEYDSSAYFFLKAFALSEHYHDKGNSASVLNNVGEVYLANDQFDQARQYFSMSLEINKKINKKEVVAINLTNLGRVSSAEGKYIEALSYYDKSAELFKELKSERGLVDLENNYGDLYFNQGKLDLALEKFRNALTGYNKIQWVEGMIQAMGNLAAVYSTMGDVRKSMALQDSCLKLTYSENRRDLRVDIFANISNNYEKKGDFKNAFKYLQMHYKLKDSIFDINKTRVINELSLKYDKEKDQARILALEKDNLQKTNERNAFIFIVIGIIVIAAFTIIYFRQRAVREKLIAAQKIRQLEDEKKMMAARLLVEGQEVERKRIATELHDGLGVLLSATKMQFSTISASSPENKALIDKATKMLEQASGDVRKISHNMMPGLLTKLGFYEAAEDLFEHIADTTKLDAVCTITGDPERLPENKEIMLYRIVQEMVNNTIKHAEAGKIELKIDVSGKSLEMKYNDDGKGFDVAAQMDSESLGLKSIQSRVNFLNATLQIDSEAGKGTQFFIRMPL